MTQPNLQLGDAVVVKPNVEDPDLNINIGGWQGRVSEINEEDNVVCIDWDSLTLKQMSAEVIDQCAEEGLDWSKMYLSLDEVEPTSARDSEDEVEKVVEFLESKYSWSILGEQGRRIQAVLEQAKNESEWAAFEAWEEYFWQELKFPFEAEVADGQDRGPIRIGDEVKVLGINGRVELYGILVAVRRKRMEYVLPLCDLEVSDKTSSNYQPVKDYAVWFANR